MTVIYFIILYFILAYIQHNGDVSLENSERLAPRILEIGMGSREWLAWCTGEGASISH